MVMMVASAMMTVIVSISIPLVMITVVVPVQGRGALPIAYPAD
jgi:hypothetical protein